MAPKAERNIIMYAGGESTTFEIFTTVFITYHIFQYASDN
jgi:hypothetical protein